jgi:exopolyphosphatase/guanosine-5'-triphosphate,3'-diphosphate pyrophosphatase
MLLGAIDVGTNSIHLIVVEMDAQFGTSRTVLKAREMVRLGGGDALARGYLGKKAIARGVAAIGEFARMARAQGVSDVRAVFAKNSLRPCARPVASRSKCSTISRRRGSSISA